MEVRVIENDDVLKGKRGTVDEVTHRARAEIETVDGCKGVDVASGGYSDDLDVVGEAVKENRASKGGRAGVDGEGEGNKRVGGKRETGDGVERGAANKLDDSGGIEDGAIGGGDGVGVRVRFKTETTRTAVFPIV